nr:immunoglobulin light chain junction region [Macaca mulatta]MOX72831.1 immunoglobulin light chain junction region [Macaca mulatta]MOX73992.1 immunoglobulin light chain junction region [Macaca mulatta]MOX74801.1 immunoglobulin light chain junction region [Macaca mulatta]MOX75477.1 immunoglobulin light chain junction region [Macaca mulatta]
DYYCSSYRSGNTVLF